MAFDFQFTDNIRFTFGEKHGVVYHWTTNLSYDYYRSNFFFVDSVFFLNWSITNK